MLNIIKLYLHLKELVIADLVALPTIFIPVLPAGNVLQKNSMTALNYKPLNINFYFNKTA